MNDVMNCIFERRSIRKYKSEQITDGELDTILQAALYAPCAGGRQGVAIAVCQNEKTILKLGKINKAVFRGRVVKDSISKEQPSTADDPAIESGFYNAPTVLFLFAPDNFLYGTPDCCVAAENIMLAAYSLGLGSCMIMRAEDTFSSELGGKCLKEWAIPEGWEAKAIVLLGYPDGVIPAAKPRKEGRIVRIK
jgi:nitroreductase